MSYSNITINNSNITLVSFPTSVGLRSFDMTISDAVSTVNSPYTGQTQAQLWPGGDMWSGTATLAPLQQAAADDWISFLMQLRGPAYAFQMGDPLKQTPRGTPSGNAIVDNTQNNGNPAMSTQLGTTGWTASTANLLMRGDNIQVGYRLYRVTDTVASDSNGNAVVNIWPSLREQPVNSANVITENTQGLWRLSTTTRTYSFDTTQLTRISYKFQEYR
jgi:hypothetical protein